MEIRTVDVAGLSPEAVRTVESVVGLLRGANASAAPNVIDPERWSEALRRWAKSHATRDIEIDDSREAIYSGRGE